MIINSEDSLVIIWSVEPIQYVYYRRFHMSRIVLVDYLVLCRASHKIHLSLKHNFF